jgi:type I restriction enzyme S subunit
MTKVLRLSEFAEVGAGNSAPQNEGLFKGGTLPFVRTSDVGAIHIGSIESSRDLLTTEGAKGLKLFPAGTILFPKSGASTFLNHRVILNIPTYVSSHLATIKANNGVALDRYIFYFLQTVDARDLCQDQAYPSLNRDQIAGIKVPLPSLEKQREIVERLDNAFAEIDLLEGNLGFGDEKANQLVQSILSTAFYHSSTFSEQSDLSAKKDLDVKLMTLVDLCKLVGGGTPSKANSKYYSGEIPWATVRDMRSRWLEDTEHKINGTAVKESSTNIIPSGNVVLASRVGLGKVIQLRQDTAINQDLRALIPRENSKIDSNYLYYWTLSIIPEIIAAGKGATVQGVTLPFLENLLVPLPSLDKQVEIVKKLDSAFAEIELLKARIKIEKDYVIALRKSLLSNAFTSEEAVG